MKDCSFNINQYNVNWIDGPNACIGRRLCKKKQRYILMISDIIWNTALPVKWFIFGPLLDDGLKWCDIVGTVGSALLWGFQICNQFHDRMWISNDTGVFNRQSRTKLETIFKVQRRSTPLNNCRMVNSYTCVILWVLLEADFHKVSIYVINVPIVCQMAEIHANHRPTAVKTSYGPDFRGDFFHPTRFISFLSY